MAALTAIHDFRQTGVALVGDIAPVSEHSVLLAHALEAILLVIIELIQILIVVKMTGLLDHVLAVFLRRMCAGGKVKEVEAFRKIFDLRRGLWLCQHDHSAQLFHIRF